jgi:hypothetical protein
MAGRPRKMLSRIAAMEETAYQLACDLCEARPKQYAEREGRENGEELAERWNDAAHYVQVALIFVGELLCTLERKAGLGDEPEQRRLAERGIIIPVENAEGVELTPAHQC